MVLVSLRSGGLGACFRLHRDVATAMVVLPLSMEE
jgi:hypothetical protein